MRKSDAPEYAAKYFLRASGELWPENARGSGITENDVKCTY
jgi:hypothetical protein